ncbi:MAG: serine hydrolase, partial [Gammaproteobacteria bacterium]|nr:serine hydrolase [Gammaproteobacteria bacterium]
VEIAKGGESIYSISRGSTELGGRVPVGGDTIYVVASMSKPMVSTTVLKLTVESALANTVKSALIRKLIQGV